MRTAILIACGSWLLMTLSACGDSPPALVGEQETTLAATNVSFFLGRWETDLVTNTIPDAAWGHRSRAKPVKWALVCYQGHFSGDVAARGVAGEFQVQVSPSQQWEITEGGRYVTINDGFIAVGAVQVWRFKVHRLDDDTLILGMRTDAQADRFVATFRRAKNFLPVFGISVSACPRVEGEGTQWASSMDGRSLARHMHTLNSMLDRQGDRGLRDYFVPSDWQAYSHPKARWFAAAEGVEVVDRMIALVNKREDTFLDAKELECDLKAFRAALLEAGRANKGWNWGVFAD